MEKRPFNWQHLLPNAQEEKSRMRSIKETRVDLIVMGGGIICLIGSVAAGSPLWSAIGGLTLAYGVMRALRVSGYGEWLS